MNKKDKLKLYARALAEIVFEKPISVKTAAWQGKIVEGFLIFLKKKGQEGGALEILRLAEDILLQKEGKRKIALQTARKITDSQKKMLKTFVKAGDVVVEKINPELIAGIKIIINDSKQFDASLQSKLQGLYK